MYICKNPPGNVNLKLNIIFTVAVGGLRTPSTMNLFLNVMMSCSRSIVTSEISQQATVQLFLWCFSSLSGGLVHSSKNTNIAAQLSTGLCGVNFTAGRIKACNCSGIACYPGHAYSVAGPWARAPWPKPNPQLFTCFFLCPQWILFLFIPVCFFPVSHFLSPSYSSVERAEEID